MNKETLGYGLQGLSIIIGIITVITFASRHPLIIGLLVAGAGCYFAGQYIRKGRI